MVSKPHRTPVVEVLDDAVADILRRKSPAEKLTLITQGWTTARTLLTAQVRHLHPNQSDDFIRTEVSRRMANGST